MHANMKLWPFSKELENLFTSVIHKAISQYLPHKLSYSMLVPKMRPCNLTWLTK